MVRFNIMSRLNLPTSDFGKMATMACLLKNSLAELLPVKPGKEPEAGLLAHEPVGYALVPPQLLVRLQQEVPLFQERAGADFAAGRKPAFG